MSHHHRKIPIILILMGMIMVAIWRICHPQIEPTFSNYIEAGERAMNHGYYRSAVEKFHRAVVVNPKNKQTKAQYLLVKKIRRAKNLDKSAAKNYLEQHKEDPNVMAFLALRELGDMNNASEIFEKSLELSPDLSIAQYGLGLIAMRKGHYADAVDSFTTVLREKPLDARYLTSYAHTLTAIGEYDQARKSYRKTLSRQYKWVESHIGLAYGFLAQGKTESAEKELNDAAKKLARGGIMKEPYNVLSWCFPFLERCLNLKKDKQVYVKMMQNRIKQQL